MENKVLVKLLVPEIDEEYDIFLPINKKIGNIIILLNKAINEMSNNVFIENNYSELYNATTGQTYEPNILLNDTNIRNNTKLILISNRA